MAFQHSCCWTFISLILNVLLILCDGQVTSSVQDQVKCTGDNITINWAYNTANLLVTTWQFESSTIMTGAGLSTPNVVSAYTGRATHGGNGVLTLSGLTPADTGTYTIRIDYSAAPTLARDSVAVTVYDKITQASTPQCGTDTVTCGNASMSGVSYSWKVGNAVVPHVSPSISLRSGTNTYECTISGNRVTNCLDAGVGTTQSTNCTLKGKTCDTTCVIIICVVIYFLGVGAVLIVLAVDRRFCKTCPCCEEYTGIGCRAICVIIGTSLGMGIIVAVVILIVLGKEKKLPCQKGSQHKKPDSGSSGDKKIERSSKVNEKNTKPLSPSALALTNEAKPGGRALPPIPQQEKKKKTPRKKKKRVKTEDGEDTEKLPPIQKKERNIEHYTRDTQDPES